MVIPSSAFRLSSADDPATVVWLHPDVRVVPARGGGGEEDERGIKAGRLVCLTDQFLADPLALVLRVNGEVGQVATVTVIRDGA
jgi:hypothetical protein